jgi:hypothetical protein
MLGLILAVLVFGLGAGIAAAQPPVWVVRSRTATIVLFGSVHLLPPGLDWEPAALKSALAEADDVWFEIPVDPAATLAAGQAAAAQGLQPPGQTLSAELSPADQVRLARIAQSCGLPVAGLDQLKPWYADVTLSVASYRLAGAMVDDGVERQLASQLPPTVQRRAFETPQEQIGYLASSPLPDQLAGLRETMGELEQGPTSYQNLVRAWMSGNARAVRKQALTPIIDQAPGVYRRLVVDRNHRWLPAILDRLNGRGEAVMVVGIGHLVGSDGLPALLRSQGVRVEGP